MALKLVPQQLHALAKRTLSWGDLCLGFMGCICDVLSCVQGSYF